MYHFICAFTQNMANASKIVSRGDGFPDFYYLKVNLINFFWIRVTDCKITNG